MYSSEAAALFIQISWDSTISSYEFFPFDYSPGDLYVDGALFDNFPLNAFDGWFLKAGPDGSFHDQVLKLNPTLLEDKASAVDAVKMFRESLASSYAEPNQATIGFRITNSDDPDNFAYSAFLSGLEKKLGTNSSTSNEAETNKEAQAQAALPDTKLAWVEVQPLSCLSEGKSHISVLIVFISCVLQPSIPQEDKVGASPC